MPQGSLRFMTEDGPVDLSTDELFRGRRVVLVSVPGAFTKTCSLRHLPGYVQWADELFALGVDEIAFMAVNDVDVMHAWGLDQGVGDKIRMLADGNGDYVRALGLELDLRVAGMGRRGQRFAVIVDDGIATHVAVEQPRTLDVSAAEAILERLRDLL
jgi:peroxiredoxin